jgi:hypothetical protein
MIARHEAQMDKMDVWSKLAAPLPGGVVSWRQDGKPIARDGRYFARFVAYIEANTVRERLDGVVPGEWDLTLELLPPIAGADDDAKVAFKARLQILGVIREDVGNGKDYKSAATDAFKRVGVRFGIAHELYAYEQNWVQVDGDGKFAKPLEDPQTAYVRRYGAPGAAGTEAPAPAPVAAVAEKPARAARTVEQQLEVPVADTAPALTEDAVSCPKCGGRMWDNRASKRNPKAPDFKCRDRSCDGVIWPPRAGNGSANGSANGDGKQPAAVGADADAGAPLALGADDIPF